MKFHITGAYKATGKEASVLIKAETQEAAIEKASAHDILTATCVQVHEEPGVAAPAVVDTTGRPGDDGIFHSAEAVAEHAIHTPPAGRADEPVCVTLGRGLGLVNFGVIWRSAIFLLGGFAATQILYLILANIYDHPIWLDFVSWLGNCLALVVIYMAVEATVTILTSPEPDSFWAAALRVARLIVTGFPAIRKPVCLLLLLAGISAVLALSNIIPEVGHFAFVIAWPLQIALKLIMVCVFVWLAAVVMLEPYLRVRLTTLTPRERNGRLRQLVVRYPVYWLECSLWVGLGLYVFYSVFGRILSQEPAKALALLGVERARNLFGSAPDALDALVTVPGLASPFIGVVPANEAGIWMTLASCGLVVMHAVVYILVTSAVLSCILAMLYAALERLLSHSR